MEETTKQEMKKPCCCCSAAIGALVIVFAWWQVSWGAVALTVLGVMIILKEVISQCCCGPACKPKTGN